MSIFAAHNQTLYKFVEIMADQKENSELFLEKELLSPYTYFSQVKGKQLRNKIAFAFNYWLQVPTEKLTYLIDLGSMLYGSFTIIALSEANMQINISQTTLETIRVGDTDDCRSLAINGVLTECFHMLNHDLMTKNSLQKALDLCPEAYNVIIEEYVTVYRGQGTEIYWRDNSICPTEQQFRKMIEQKTGRFFVMAIRLLQLCSENKTDYSKLALIIGIYFQVYDDYCNLNYQKGLEGWPGDEDRKVCNDKRFCEDITEGKFTLPIIHAMQTKDGEKILNILRQKTSDVELKKYCMSLLEKTGSLQYTRDVLVEFDRKARAEVARLGGNPVFDAVLDEFLDWQK